MIRQLRRALLPWLCALLLLAAQHEARQHALLHLDGHGQTAPQHDTESGCPQCLACAAAAHLAAAVVPRLRPLPRPRVPVAALPAATASVQPAAAARNRGPPASA